MIPAKFDYIKASSLNEALQLLDRHGMDAQILAGGQSLLPAMKLRLNRPGVLVDIGGIPGLNEIKEEGDSLIIGANCIHAAITGSELVAKHVGLLAEAAASIGDIQVRNLGTLGGSLAHADPSADYPAVVLACDAVITVAGKKESRDIAAADFFQGIFMTALAEDEIITSIRFPKTKKGTYQKFYQAASRFAVAGVAVVWSGDGIKVGITGVADTPYRATAVEEAYDGTGNAATKAVDGVEVMSDHFADAEYRSHLARHMVRKALES